MATEQTIVSKKEISKEELDSLLGTPGPGADNIMVPDETKPNVFSRKKVDLSFIDKDEQEKDKDVETITSETNSVNTLTDDVEGTSEKPDGKAIVDEVTTPEKDFDGTEDTSTKNTIAEGLKTLVKKGKLIPFDDDKPLEDYTTKDLEELLDANFKEKEQNYRQQIPQEFFESLPDELKVAAKYVADGGQDIKGLFHALAQAEEVTSLDPTNPTDHEKIIRQFLTTTGFGTSEEIDEEIAGIKDRDELEKKAGQFKPKLDKMQEAVISQKLADQEQRQTRQAAAAKAYVGNIYKTLEIGELNGIKLDRKTQELLYSGLVQPRYPSISGKSTNLLGHLLEKYQYVEPKHDLIAEALWLLADPESYRSKLIEKGKNKATEKTIRQLRTEESNRTPGSTVIEKDETVKRRVPRSNPNFFKR